MFNCRSIALVATLFSALGVAACETTEMSAKAGPDELGNASAGSCARTANSRSECDDKAGCFWDMAANRCAAH